MKTTIDGRGLVFVYWLFLKSKYYLKRDGEKVYLVDDTKIFLDLGGFSYEEYQFLNKYGVG